MKRFLVAFGLVSSVALLAGSGTLLHAHVVALRDVRDLSLPLASTLPPLEQRLQILKKQIDLAELQAQLRTGSTEEKLTAYVLPEGDDLDRLLAFFDVTRLLLEQSGMLRAMSPIDVGEAAPVDGAPTDDDHSASLTSRLLTFDATLSDEGLRRVQSLIEFSGNLTVGDILTPEQINMLFDLTESENYAGIVPVEKLLSTPLDAYLREPKSYEEQVLRSLSSERFLAEFRRLLQDSRLHEAHELLGGEWGNILQKQRLWPTQFMALESISVEGMPDDWQRVKLEVLVYGRSEK